jgi:hypothetical protein
MAPRERLPHRHEQRGTQRASPAPKGVLETQIHVQGFCWTEPDEHLRALTLNLNLCFLLTPQPLLNGFTR